MSSPSSPVSISPGLRRRTVDRPEGRQLDEPCGSPLAPDWGRDLTKIMDPDAVRTALTELSVDSDPRYISPPTSDRTRPGRASADDLRVLLIEVPADGNVSSTAVDGAAELPVGGWLLLIISCDRGGVYWAPSYSHSAVTTAGGPPSSSFAIAASADFSRCVSARAVGQYVNSLDLVSRISRNFLT